MTWFAAFFEIYKSSDLQVFKKAGIIIDLQLLRKRGPHWFATKQSLFLKKMKAFWGDFALVDNLEKASWKISEKKSYFQKNYSSSKAKELKALLNLVSLLLCIINVFPFNERLNSKCFLSFQQNSIYQMQYSLFIPAILKKFLSVSSSNMQQCFTVWDNT